MIVCIASRYAPSSLPMGGHFWVYLNWSLGFQANGCEVIWMDSIPSGMLAGEAGRVVKEAISAANCAGLRLRVCLLGSKEERARRELACPDLDRLTISLEEAQDKADLLVNFRYFLSPDTVSRFRRSALLDIDPGLLQLWASDSPYSLPSHDIYFTTGETVGSPAARFPDCGVEWHYIPPSVFLPSWPVMPARQQAPYTTVSSWWSKESLTYMGESFLNDKRAAFLEYLELPARTPARLELALALGVEECDDRSLLKRHGWSIREAQSVAKGPEGFHHYVQRSRGEFSCAKPSCMRLSNAWVSDRTLCYLASGKPVVVQHTGPSCFLPDAHGMFRFRSLDDAAAAIACVESDYERQCRHARTLAEEHFDATVNSARILEKAV